MILTGEYGFQDSNLLGLANIITTSPCFHWQLGHFNRLLLVDAVNHPNVCTMSIWKDSFLVSRSF